MPTRWVTARGSVSLEQPTVVGILNITPDSFSDGGLYLDRAAALERVEVMLAHEVDMIDIGAESTRPGRPSPVAVDEEWRRLEPVLAEVSRAYPDLPISVDTVKAETAKRALDAGAWAINDVSGLRFDAEIAQVCADLGAGLVLMHSRGPFAAMASYDHAVYHDVIGEVGSELAGAVRRAESAGVARERLVVDPGLGFSKRPAQNFELLAGLDKLLSLGLPVMVGPSRKRFLSTATGKDVRDRDVATAAVCVAAYLSGAMLFRVHAVDVARVALDAVRGIRRAD